MRPLPQSLPATQKELAITSRELAMLLARNEKPHTIIETALFARALINTYLDYFPEVTNAK